MFASFTGKKHLKGMGAKMVPHRGLPVLGTRQGCTDSVLPFEGYIKMKRKLISKA